MWSEILVFVLAFALTSAIAQSEPKVISGFVRDFSNSEAIIHASVYNKNNNTTFQTNDNGYFSFMHTFGDTSLTIYVHSFGFLREKIIIQLDQDTSLSVFLKSETIQDIAEVKIIAQRKAEIGTIEMPIKQLKQIPMLGGESDVIKAFQLMPGVAGGKEGTSGLYVRGGSPDQNLFLLDNIPLYYVSHIGGFVSTFDPNMINSIKLYKGNFPARYNGRLSSVIDIRMRDGNQKKRSGEIIVGLLSTKFQIDGPIKKDSSWTYMLSARRFNMDLFTRPIARYANNGQSTAGYTFYDLNAKFVKRYKDNSKLTFTLFDGRDRIFVNSKQKRDEYNQIASEFKSNVIWGNRLASLNYSKEIRKKVFASYTLATTNFRYVTDIESRYSKKGSDELTESSFFTFKSKVNDVMLKTIFDIQVSERYNLSTGWNGTYHNFTPGSIKNEGIVSKDTLIKNNIQAFENNLFGENKINLGDKAKLNLGVNFSTFSLKDTTFLSFEPRLHFNYNFLPLYSFQAGYSRMKQYLHYLSYSGAGLPSDLWIPATKELIPEVSDQFNAGFTFTQNTSKFPFQLTIEGFYKTIINLLDYKEGVSLFSAASIETKIEKGGRGKVYGIEFLAQKTIGKTTGWIAYTWSKNDRTFENLNGGKTFPFKFDRRHDVSVVFAHTFSDRISINATWVFSTGNAITLAQSKYYQIDLGTYYNNNTPQSYQLNTAEEYNGKNGFRMPSYHKLDIGASFTKVKPKGTRTWTFGVYNVYNQQNPFLLLYKKNKSNQVTLHQLTLFPIIPSFSYSFAF